MKINLKCLMSSILVPISVIAGDLEGDLNKEFNIGHLDAAAHSVSSVASNSSATTSPFDDNVKPQLTFKHARNLLYFGGTKERQLARIALCEFVQNKESSTFFGKSYSFLSARHLLNSNDNEPNLKLEVQPYVKVLLLWKRIIII